ncbi:MAG: Peptidase S24-like protein [Candidatus Bathyarchaeota archaeon BA1]|nr:MAG: Peptidase S24-like protein [Candidatus Bathyarchaeota archaeon BA1]
MRSKLLKSEFMKTAIVLSVTIIGVAVFWLGLRAALRTEFPIHAVMSESMVPALNVGDLLVVQGVANADEINAVPRAGDIIVFRKPTNRDEFIVHRAIGKIYIDGWWFFRTKGDHNLVEDPWNVPEYDVIGRVVGRIPLLGYIKIFLGTTLGIAVIILLMLLLLFMDYIPMLRKVVKDKEPSLYKNPSHYQLHV